jgi:three-Cys-motif partner protein
MRSTQTFGGDWTQDKLSRLEKYLRAYTTIFASNPRAQYFETVYVDAFAGTGYNVSRIRKAAASALAPEEIAEEEAQGFLKGSARKALEVEPRFKRYLFIEQHAARFKELESLRSDYPEQAGRIELVNGDANVYLAEWCANTDWTRTRAVVFLDPFGMEVKWPLLQAIAATKAIDLWLLFPISGINRHLTTDERPPADWAARLTEVLGTDDWLPEFYVESPQLSFDLFGQAASTPIKEVNFDRLGAYFVNRLRTLFPGVADNPLPLRNSMNSPLFLLCFAAGNEKGAPTAIRIAQDILRR